MALLQFGSTGPICRVDRDIYAKYNCIFSDERVLAKMKIEKFRIDSLQESVRNVDGLTDLENINWTYRLGKH